MKKEHFFGFVLLLVCGHTQAQKQTFYEEAKTEIVNPERGFYLPLGATASRFVLLDSNRLKAYRSQSQQPGKASYKVKVSLIHRGYELDVFKNKPLSDSFLVNLQKDFDAVRAAGLKMILRFAYTDTARSGDCIDEYKICPPYGDAPRQIVLHHIGQLKPLLQKNGDVIAVMQQGFIGIWGENYFTDYFGDASTNGLGVIADSSWRHRNKMLTALLTALPKDRMVQVRTPQIKQRFVYGERAAVSAKPLIANEAHNFSDKARVGFHNDCFLATPDDYGTFYDYGNSVSKRDTANQRLRRYFESDSRYVAVGGETCDDAYSPQNDCGPTGGVERDMAAMHYSYLNAAYNTDVNNDWNSAGCFKNIRDKLGYRFVLRKAIFPKSANAKLSFSFEVENVGYASPFNPRPVFLVMQNKTTGKDYFFPLKSDVRKWYTGHHSIAEIITFSSTLPKGNYHLFLWLPDTYQSLHLRPEYAVRFANENCWRRDSGYNDLQLDLSVK